MPSSLRSRPAISASSLTRRPTVALSTNQTSAEATVTKAPTIKIEVNCTEKVAALLVKQTANVPQIPAKR